MRNVRLHVDDGIVLDVARLRGEMISTVKGQPPVFDDGRSYTLRLATGELSMDMGSLTVLMNRHVFAYEGAPLKDVRVSVTRDGRLEQKGKLHKGIDVPFSMKATVGTTADGRLKLHAESVKAIGVPAKPLMGLFGLELDDVVDLKERRGIDVSDNDIVLDPGKVMPPPEMRGTLTGAEVRGDRLFLTFAGGAHQRAAALHPPAPRANYVYFSGGTIRFGKLTMSDADLELIDSDPRDPFDFFPLRYEAQLIAGYSKNTPAHGLKTYMPDFSDLRRRSGNGRRAAPR